VSTISQYESTDMSFNTKQKRILKHYAPYPEVYTPPPPLPIYLPHRPPGAPGRAVRSWTPKRPNLVLVDRGPAAAYFEVPEDRTWDYVDLFFREEDVSDDGQDAILIETDKSFRKCGATRRAELHGAPFAAYERILLADDDVAPADTTWNEIFALFKESGMNVGMPALTHDSECAHKICYQEPGTRWRRTNFMDLQAILLTREALNRYSQFFCDTMHLWGVERLFAEREGGVVILDETPIRHRSPLGPRLCYASGAPMVDYSRFMAKHGLVETPHAVLSRVVVDSVDGPPVPAR
jgi:hypothetical protein